MRLAIPNNVTLPLNLNQMKKFLPILFMALTITGQGFAKINPNPKLAPIIPNPLARSSGLVVSEMTAEATGILPAVRPSSARARNKNMALGANAMRKKDAAVPAMERTRSGLRPY